MASNEVLSSLFKGGGRHRKHGGGARFLVGWNVFHIDEKWFASKQKKTRAICLPDESSEVRSTVHKNHIYTYRSMFLSCSTFPNKPPQKQGERLHGQIAIHCFCAEQPVKASLYGHPAGTVEMKPVNVNEEVYVNSMVHVILPKIKDHWVNKMGKKPEDRLYVQEDNASSHKLAKHPPRWIEASRGWNIRLLPQPPQSPDLNKNGLGLFSSMQSLMWYKDYDSLEELQFEVIKQFWAYDNEKLLDLEITHQNVMKHIFLKNEGQHLKKLPHMNNQDLKKEGSLPKYLCLTDDELAKALNDLESVKLCADYEESIIDVARRRNKAISKRYHEERKRTAAEAQLNEDESITAADIRRSLNMPH
jgi:hypothetical protein